MSKNNLLDELLEIAAPLQTDAHTSDDDNNLPVVPPRGNITSTAIQGQEEIVVHDPVPVSTQDDDIAFARKKMRNIIKAAEDAFNELANIANETQQPRAYEVLATLLKTTTDATKELVATHKTKAEIKRLEQGGVINTAFDKGNNQSLTQVNQTIEKAVFVGTATEMMDRLSSVLPSNNNSDNNNDSN